MNYNKFKNDFYYQLIIDEEKSIELNTILHISDLTMSFWAPIETDEI